LYSFKIDLNRAAPQAKNKFPHAHIHGLRYQAFALRTRIDEQKMPRLELLHQGALRRAEDLSDDVFAAIEETF